MASKEEARAVLISVQELAKNRQGKLTVPRRYIQENREPTYYDNYDYNTTNPSNDNYNNINNVPHVDIKLLIEARSNHDLQQLDNFHSICKEWGIFQVVNHGVSLSVVEKLRNEMAEFYKLPLEEKMRYQLKGGDFEGYGQTIIHSQDESIVDWADRFYIITNPTHKRKPNLLPQLPSSLRDSIELYLVELQKLAMTLLEIMGEALKMEKRELEEMFEDGMQSIRMNYYPACPEPDLVMGLRPHSDATGITILKQINGVNGLEVKKDGVWIPVKILPDSFVVNVGDILEIVSNGVYKSIEHRATVNSESERISIGMFFLPNSQAYVGPSPSLITQENPPLYKRVTMPQYVKDFFSRKFIGKTYLEHLKIGNAANA